MVSTLRRTTLANGLRVAVIEMPYARHVSIRVMVDAGSRDDPRDKAGISHFVEHLLFRGNARHSHEGALRAHVASLGANVNAQTGKEYTSLQMDVSVEHASEALRVLAEMIRTPTFNGIEVERRIVLEEMANVRDETDGEIWEIEAYTDTKLWPYNSLGVPVLGEPRTVLGITLDDAREYMARHYVAGGMALTVAGGIELAAIAGDIERLFGGLPPGRPFKSRTAPGTRPGALHVIEHFNASRSRARLVFPCSGFGAPAASIVSSMLAVRLLASHGAGRIHDVLRSRAGIAYSGDADVELFTDVGRLWVQAEVKKENIPQLVTALTRMLRDLRDRGPTPDELEAARASYILLLDTVATNPAEAAWTMARSMLIDDQWVDEDIADARAATHGGITEFARATFRSKTGHLVIAGPREEDDLRAAWRAFESGLAD